MKEITLTTLAIRNHALAAHTLPGELHLLKWGENSSSKGPICVGAQTRTRLPLLQRERRFDRVAIDYEHNTVPGTRAYKESREPREVAAYGVPDPRPDGLWLTDLEWTPSGSASARNYSDLSPTVQQDERGEVVFLHSVALCRQGSVDGLRFYNVTLEDKRPMDIKTLMAKLLGKKAEEYSDDDIGSDLDGLSPVMAALSAADPEQIKALLGLDVPKLVALTQLNLDALTALSALDCDRLKVLSVDDGGGADDDAPLSALSARLEALEADLEAGKRSALVAQASREGKVIPLSQEQIADIKVTVLSAMIDKLDPTVPVEQRTPEHLKHLSVDGGDTALSRMAALCGYTMDEVAAANS